jgi:hypothetical protein
MKKAMLLCVLLCAPAAGEDEVKLKNGDRLSGTVKGMDKGKLSLATPHSGDLKVDWAQVASLKTDAKVKVRMATGDVFEGKLGPGQDGRLKVETEGAAQPVEVDLGKVTHLNEAPAAWHGNVALAARATDGNTHTTSFLASAEALRLTEQDLILVRAIFRYGDKSGDLTERNGYGLAKYQYNFAADLYGYASVELLSDRFKDLRLGTVVSVGAGYTILKESWIDFAAEAGFAYFDNNFRELQEDESHAGGRASARLRVALPLGFEVKDLFTIYPNFEDHADWQIRNEATLGTALGGGWSLLGGVISEVDNEPAPGLVEVDNTYFVGLGFVF